MLIGRIPKPRKKGLYLALMSVSLMAFILGVVIGIASFSREPLLEVKRTIELYSYASIFDVDYILRPNALFNESKVNSGSYKFMYISLVRYIEVNHTFVTVGAESVNGNASIVVSVAHPDGWAKEYKRFEVPLSRGITSTAFTINLSDVLRFMDALTRDIGISYDNFRLVIEAFVVAEVSTNNRTDRLYVPHPIALNVKSSANRIIGPANLTIKDTETQSHVEKRPVYMLGMGIEFARGISLLIVALSAVGIVFGGLKARSPPSPLRAILKSEAKYKALIVEASDSPVLSSSYYIVELSSLDELAKVARLLERPILKYRPREKPDEYIYAIHDREYTYIYRVSK